MLRIDVFSSRELQALILSVRQANREVQAQIRKQTRLVVVPEWQRAVAEQANTQFEHRVLVSTARVAVSNQNVTLKSGGLSKKLSGGAKAYELAPQAEFGAPLRKITYTAHRNGKAYQVTRTSGRQFKHENKRGWVVYPAAAQIIPRIAALWVQTAVRTFHEALEKDA